MWVLNLNHGEMERQPTMTNEHKTNMTEDDADYERFIKLRENFDDALFGLMEKASNGAQAEELLPLARRMVKALERMREVR